MKYISALFFILAAGCSNSSDRWEIEYAQSKCQSRGGIHHIDVPVIGTLNAYCMDGSKVVVPLTPRKEDASNG